MSDLSVQTTEMHGWLDRIHAGDRLALETLLKRVTARLTRLSVKMLRRFPRVQRWADPDDILQNATMRLIRALQDVRPESMRDFYALAATQIRRELLDLTRALYGPHGDAANHVTINPDDSDERRQLDPPQPEDDRELERWCSFHEEVEKLPPEEREVVGLIFYHGWKQEEVADLFGVNVRTVQRWWRDALVRLKDLLADWPVQGS